MPNLTKRRSTFYYQKRVPTELQHIWPQKFIRVSLGTSDSKEANRRASPVIQEWDTRFDLARQGRLYLDHELSQFIHDWQARVDADTGINGARVDLPPLTTEQALQGCLSTLQAHHGITLGEPDRTRLQQLLDHPEPVVPCTPRPVIARGPTLDAVFEAYVAERQMTAKTADQFEKYLAEFQAGRVLRLGQIDRPLVIAWKDRLLQSDMATDTIRKRLAALKATLNFAKAQGHIQTNPAEGVKVVRAKRAQKAKLPFSIDDLNQIIEAVDDDRGSRFWITMVAMFTGARRNEICQLQASDVKHRDGIAFIDINPVDSQSVKTQESIREVPVHPVLIDIGFLDYVKSRRGKPLFELPGSVTRQAGDRFNDIWKSWWREATGIHDPRKSFNSMRHAFKDAGRHAGLDKAVIDSLQGHVDGSAAGGYGSGYSLSRLAEAMAMIEYPGLRLPVKKGRS